MKFQIDFEGLNTYLFSIKSTYYPSPSVLEFASNYTSTHTQLTPKECRFLELSGDVAVMALAWDGGITRRILVTYDLDGKTPLYARTPATPWVVEFIKNFFFFDCDVVDAQALTRNLLPEIWGKK